MNKLLPLGLLVATLASGENWKRAVPSYAWSFPRDHFRHDGYRSEWWYLTGHLESKSDPGRRFGYQFTFFRIGVLPESPELDSTWTTTSLVMGHAAILDLKSGRHRFSELLYREIPLLAGFSDDPTEGRIGWSHGPVGTDEPWLLKWNGEGFDFSMRDHAKRMSFTLSTRPMKPLVFQGPGGFSQKGTTPEAASHYYSFTRLMTEGQLEIGGESFSVSGESWMDKEFSSSQLTETQVGWDWFSLQLDDGRELMLYLMRRSDGSFDFRRGTLVGTDGTPHYLADEEWEVRVLAFWESPVTSARYPSGWRISLFQEGLAFEVYPLAEDQENRSRLPAGIYYWEGACEIRDLGGGRIGQGYVELTGYGEGNRPPV